MELASGKEIFLFGLGFLLGYFVSLRSLDMVYKDIMKRTLDEIHRQYKGALQKNN
jgi:hypothetical protein